MAVNRPLTESQLSEKYIQASKRFLSASGWRELLEIAEEFHALDTYKDAYQMYVKCIKGASAPAYRDIKASLESNESPTVEDYREAARIMGIIQDYSNARELMRVYTLKANSLSYNQAVELIANSEATTDDWQIAIELLRSIKGFKDSREMLERYERYYFDRVYSEALALMENGHVYSEFEEAAELFERIPTYSDASSQAQACRKKANQLRPKVKKQKPSKKQATPQDDATTVMPKKSKTPQEQESIQKPKRAKRAKDETVYGFAEVWHTLDKRKLFVCILWFLGFIASIAVSILIGSIKHTWVVANANTIRFITIITAAITGIMGARAFLRMLTASMRKKLTHAMARLGKKLEAPFVKVFNNLLLSIGIDLSRRRLGGKDERSFVYDSEDRPSKKKKKKLKNELRWAEQPTNAARVRFIFIDYMIHRIRKGYLMHHAMTTLEIGQEIAIEPEEQELFDVYQMARYGGIRAEEDISSETVNRLRNINQRQQ